MPTLLCGAQGRGVNLIRTLSDLPVAEDVDDVYYFDHRRRKPRPKGIPESSSALEGIFAMKNWREADWVTSGNWNAVLEQVLGHDQGEFAELAIMATTAVGADFAGGGVVATAKPVVLEVSSMPSWPRLQSLPAVSIADALLVDLATRVANDTAAAPHARFVSSANP